ncbi:MAG TPA: HAMP domain-containing sensor histidine kinase [Acidimicrobiales bacterium]|nr:HAMP domain-containing sensor histidine kinase [Acidimicrobiales bacterium]
MESRRRVRRLRSTAVRLAAFQAVLLALALAAVTYETTRAFGSHALDDADRGLAAQVSSFTTAARQRPAGQSLASFSVTYLRSSVLPEGQVIVVAPIGGPPLGSAGSRYLLDSPALAGLLTHPLDSSVLRHQDVAGRPAALLAAPIRTGASGAGTLVVAVDLAGLRSDQHRVLALAAAEALVALVVGATAAYLLLRRLLRTIGAMTAAASAIGAGDLDQRLGDPGTDDEVGKLASTFDWMLDRISLGVAAQRRLLSDVSHQLRTPLTVARGHLEVLKRRGADDPAEVGDTISIVLDELDHMKALVERLLLLGRVLEPDFLEIDLVDLRTFMADLTEAARVLARRRWSAPPAPDVVLRVDEAKLRGALLNLIDNAVRATREGDEIEVCAERLDDGGVALTVADSGPGIPAEERAGVMARFARPTVADTEGSGLGLAIVKAVAEAHGGTFSLDASRLGGLGATMVVPSARVLEPVEALEE